MKKADLYVRVSSDEQAKAIRFAASKNSSGVLCHPEHNWASQSLLKIIRPKPLTVRHECNNLTTFVNKKKKFSLVLFLKGDRFSCNVGDAYQMINTLRKLGVEPQAIEQVWDLTVPENKMNMSASEIEKDWRGDKCSSRNV